MILLNLKYYKMRMKIRFIISTLVLGFLAINSSYAQALPEFSLSTSAADAGISLDKESPLSNQYEMDISSKGWTESQATSIAKSIDVKSDKISLEVDYPNQRIILNLNTDTPTTNGWDVLDWDSHLKTIF